MLDSGISHAGEKPHYRRALGEAGIAVRTLDESLRFEGEADFFPAGDRYLLTYGRLERQRFVPALGFPPWRRVYGFRTDARRIVHEEAVDWKARTNAAAMKALAGFDRLEESPQFTWSIQCPLHGLQPF